MEFDWERSVPFLKLSDSIIYKLLEGSIDVKEISKIESINKGCRTTNYLVACNRIKKKFLLKIFIDENYNYEKEITIFKNLKNDIPLQEIYKFSKHEAINNKQYALYEYIDGFSISDFLRNSKNNIDCRLVKSIANTLAKIHKYKFQKIGFLDENLEVNYELPPLLNWYEICINENVNKKLGSHLVKKILKIVDKYNEDLSNLDKDPRLVHGDFQFNNILINNGKVVGVIDWEFSMAGHPLADIGQFFRNEEYFDKDLIRIFQEEYSLSSNYNLNSNWYEVSKIRDLVNLIQLLMNDKEMPNKCKDIKKIVTNIVNQF